MLVYRRGTIPKTTPPSVGPKHWALPVGNESIVTLPETNIADIAPENRPKPKSNPDRLPTIHFQRQKC